MLFGSRRSFISSAAGAAAATSSLGQQAGRALVLKLQFTTGGHTVPLQQYGIFDDPLFEDVETRVFPHPRAFDHINGPAGPDVIALGDYLTSGWPEADRAKMRDYLDSGKGLVVLHHAVGDNQQWPWFYEEVTGGALLQLELPGKLRSGLEQWPRQRLTPVGEHPIIRGMKPFEMPRDELFYNMWFSPKITTLLRSDDPHLANVNGTIAWVGVHPKARVACIQSGHTDIVNADPRYRRIVHNMVLWAGRKLS